MKNILVFGVLAAAVLNSYFAGKAVDTTVAVHDAQRLANGCVGALEHFQGLNDELVKMLAEQVKRTIALEKYIRAHDLPVPGRAPATPEPREKISDNKLM